LWDQLAVRQVNFMNALPHLPTSNQGNCFRWYDITSWDCQIYAVRSPCTPRQFPISTSLKTISATATLEWTIWGNTVPSKLKFNQKFQLPTAIHHCGERGLLLRDSGSEPLLPCLTSWCTCADFRWCPSSVDNQTATDILNNLSKAPNAKLLPSLTSCLLLPLLTVFLSWTRWDCPGWYSYWALQQPGLYRSLWNQHQMEELLR